MWLLRLESVGGGKNIGDVANSITDYVLHINLQQHLVFSKNRESSVSRVIGKKTKIVKSQVHVHFLPKR
jgi:phosphotransferase system IIB component